jgi:hypothetical protein
VTTGFSPTWRSGLSGLPDFGFWSPLTVGGPQAHHGHGGEPLPCFAFGKPHAEDITIPEPLPIFIAELHARCPDHLPPAACVCRLLPACRPARPAHWPSAASPSWLSSPGSATPVRVYPTWLGPRCLATGRRTRRESRQPREYLAGYGFAITSPAVSRDTPPKHGRNLHRQRPLAQTDGELRFR